MKDSRPKIDERVIDELVSGQLTGERYRAALRALDAEPAKWRDCALAFLEEQALRSELRALAQGTIDWSEGNWPERNWTDGSPIESAGSVAANLQPSIENKITSLQSKKDWSGSFKTILSTAALLLISFTVGW